MADAASQHAHTQPEEDKGRVRGKFIPRIPKRLPVANVEQESTKQGANPGKDASGSVSVMLRVKRRRDEAPLELLVVEGRSSKRPSMLQAMQSLSMGQTNQDKGSAKLFRLLQSVPATGEEESPSENAEDQSEAASRPASEPAAPDSPHKKVVKKSVQHAKGSTVKAIEDSRGAMTARKREAALSALKIARSSATGSRRFGNVEGVRVVDVDINASSKPAEGETKAQKKKEAIKPSVRHERPKAEIIEDSDLEDEDERDGSKNKGGACACVCAVRENASTYMMTGKIEQGSLF
jgi:hypothetical protein